MIETALVDHQFHIVIDENQCKSIVDRVVRRKLASRTIQLLDDGEEMAHRLRLSG